MLSGRNFIILGDFNRDFGNELRRGFAARLDGSDARDPILPDTEIGSILKEVSDNTPQGTYLYLAHQHIDGKDRQCRTADDETYKVRSCHWGIDNFLIGKHRAETASDNPGGLTAEGADYGDEGYCAAHACPSDHCPMTLEIRVPTVQAHLETPSTPAPTPSDEPSDLGSSLPSPPAGLVGPALRSWFQSQLV